jgi:protein-S-isoprenylcysteine O-methyltransferase Ste14
MRSERPFSGMLALGYGAVCYLAFLAAFAYLIGFVGDLGVPRSVSAGPAAPLGTALGADLGLLALFALQHSLMARPRFKAAWTRRVPPAAERSTYVLAASLALAVLFRFWLPLPGLAWRLGPPGLRLAVQAVFAAGVALTLASTFLISHLDLFGLRQAWARFRNRPYREPGFRPTALYTRIRHPLMLGFLATFWAGADMTWGRLLFAAGMTGYILAGTRLEERDLVQALGPPYAAYRREVPRFFPVPWRRAGRPPKR